MFTSVKQVGRHHIP